MFTTEGSSGNSKVSLSLANLSQKKSGLSWDPWNYQKQHTPVLYFYCSVASIMSDSLWPHGLFCPWDFLRQEYWSKLSFTLSELDSYFWYIKKVTKENQGLSSSVPECDWHLNLPCPGHAWALSSDMHPPLLWNCVGCATLLSVCEILTNSPASSLYLLIQLLCCTYVVFSPLSYFYIPLFNFSNWI